MINIKDSSGVIKSKKFTVKVYTALVNESSINKENIMIGSYVLLRGKASGGTGLYSYIVMYKLKTDANFKLSQSTADNSPLSFTPETSGKYDVRIAVMDETGEFSVVDYDLTVN